MKEKILIIGSNSFSGSNLTKHLLSKGIEVIGVSRSCEPHNVFLPYKINKNIKNFSFNKINIVNRTEELISLVKKKKPSIIINYSAQGMVAESWDKPIDWYQTNLISQIKFHDEIRKFDFIHKYIHFTTPEVYGSTNKWIKENNIFAPSTPYAVSRAACDLHLLSFKDAYNFPVIFTRAANVYGPHQQLYRIIPRAIIAAKTGKKLNLHGGGKSVRSFIHIDDVSKALLKIIKNGNLGDTYHISGNQLFSIKKIVTLVANAYNKKLIDLVELVDERTGKDAAYKLDSNKLREELDWDDKIDIEKGILETIVWVENNFKALNQQSLSYKHKS